MLRDVFPSKAILIGIIFFGMVVGGTQLYYWHVRRTGEAELERTKQMVQALEETEKKRPATNADVPIDTYTSDTSEMPIVFNDTQPMAEEREALPSSEAESDELLDAFLVDEILSTEGTDEVLVSPFGFGAYPEVPPDFPERFMPIWTWSDEKRAKAGSSEIDFELMHRVLIKLWNQGDRSFIGVKRQDHDGKVYPIYRNVMYVVNWIERRNGTVRLPASFFGQSDEDISVVDIMQYERIPTGITFIDAHTEGYDPYQFLGLQ
ncbi:hypothetical protein C6503_24210 [Candidatus Poribacteria bacterium]|nr:MAG: hypothetical protein C6503_24210 [Candidatus Poribacteria bacterium]